MTADKDKRGRVSRNPTAFIFSLVFLWCPAFYHKIGRIPPIPLRWRDEYRYNDT